MSSIPSIPCPHIALFINPCDPSTWPPGWQLLKKKEERARNQEKTPNMHGLHPMHPAHTARRCKSLPSGQSGLAIHRPWQLLCLRHLVFRTTGKHLSRSHSLCYSIIATQAKLLPPNYHTKAVPKSFILARDSTMGKTLTLPVANLDSVHGTQQSLKTIRIGCLSTEPKISTE